MSIVYLVVELWPEISYLANGAITQPRRHVLCRWFAAVRLLNQFFNTHPRAFGGCWKLHGPRTSGPPLGLICIMQISPFLIFNSIYFARLLDMLGLFYVIVQLNNKFREKRQFSRDISSQTKNKRKLINN